MTTRGRQNLLVLTWLVALLLAAGSLLLGCAECPPSCPMGFTWIPEKGECVMDRKCNAGETPPCVDIAPPGPGVCE